MLTLTRRKGETIYIGEDIAVTVTRIDRTQVKIGITAPDSVKVLRAELVDEHTITPGGVQTVDSAAAVHQPTLTLKKRSED